MSNILSMASSENTAAHQGTRFQSDVRRKRSGKVEQIVKELFQILRLCVL